MIHADVLLTASLALLMATLALWRSKVGLFHHQNLNEDERGRIKGFPWNGRAWLHFGGPRNSEGEHVRTIQWVFGWPQAIRFTVVLDGDASDSGNVQVTIAFLFFAFYLGARFPYEHWLRKMLPQEEAREIGFHIHAGSGESPTFHWSVWGAGWSVRGAGYGRSREDPWWKKTHLIFLDDLFLGKAHHDETLIEKVETVIPMPEKNYAATVEIVEARWHRPRWFAKKMLRFHVEIPGGIPFPGKGENSWDCGEDATYGLTARGSTVPEAVGKVVQSVLRNRERYGGRDWRPSTPAPKVVGG